MVLRFRSSTSSCIARSIATVFGELISSLSEKSVGSFVRFRGRLEGSRIHSKVGFLQLRQPPDRETVQVVVTGADLISIAKDITPESIVDVWGSIVPAQKTLRTATCSTLEVQAQKIVCLDVADSPLPFPLCDTTTKLDTKLDHRFFDLRKPCNGAIVKLVSAAGAILRRHFLAGAFAEVHTPKLIPTPSEGGSAVFSVDYFGHAAFLAQSPQLYKQMLIQGDVSRVFEVGPVFRAEKSQTHRHLTEFTGVDAEMIINGDYREVIDVVENILVNTIGELQGQLFSPLLQVVCSAFELAKWTPIVSIVSATEMGTLGIGIDSEGVPSTDEFHARVGTVACPVLRIAFSDATKLIGRAPGCAADFSASDEKLLGAMIKQRYGVDLFVVDQFPLAARPFYTMPLINYSSDVELSCSFDVYLRGEEICSGARRIDSGAVLRRRAQQCGVSLELIEDYLESFQYGVWPHGGFGIGLERLVQFWIGLPDIRYVSLFPRDPKRLSP